MIVRLAGKLLEKQPDHVVLDVNGVGYQVWLTLNSYGQLPEEGSNLVLKIFHQMREDGEALFGFVDDAERELFTHLIAISGIGAKTAISMLSGALPDDFRQRINSGDEDSLTAIKGVGPKMARRIIAELKDKLGGEGAWDEASIAASGHSVDLASQAALSLVSLGYKNGEAHRAVQAVLKKLSTDATVEEIIRAALSSGK